MSLGVGNRYKLNCETNKN